MRNKVIVTGGCGFIGSNLVEELLNKNYEVIIYDNLSTGFYKNILEFEDKITFIQGDIRDYHKINYLFDESVFGVIHLAAMVSVPISVQKPIECFDINLRASINLIEQCSKFNCKFIFASSAAVYGEDKTPVKTEDLETVPLSPYGISKLDVERMCQIFKKEKGLNYVCFRNFNVYGPKQDPNSAYAAVVPSFINNVLNGKDLVIFGDGKQTRDFIYVKDVVDAYILAMESDFSEIFNLGCNEIISVKELGEMVISKVGNDVEIVFKEERAGDIKHSRASSSKYLEISGWESKVDFDEGLDLTIDFYKKR